ncbi:hypothetical protein BROUX41_004017 [Berkeleyomyces rouxiae]|uniref:uncharacterized protein n=1 Tax=Berkeleyomyces rouxiae TaxID=2035830 RepID=UPI003B76A182
MASQTDERDAIVDKSRASNLPRYNSSEPMDRLTSGIEPSPWAYSPGSSMNRLALSIEECPFSIDPSDESAFCATSSAPSAGTSASPPVMSQFCNNFSSASDPYSGVSSQASPEPMSRASSRISQARSSTASSVACGSQVDTSSSLDDNAPEAKTSGKHKTWLETTPLPPTIKTDDCTYSFALSSAPTTTPASASSPGHVPRTTQTASAHALAVSARAAALLALEENESPELKDSRKRNRDAAARSRNKKKEELRMKEARLRSLHDENAWLLSQLGALEVSARFLEARVVAHAGCNDPLITQYLRSRSVEEIPNPASPAEAAAATITTFLGPVTPCAHGSAQVPPVHMHDPQHIVPKFQAYSQQQPHLQVCVPLGHAGIQQPTGASQQIPMAHPQTHNAPHGMFPLNSTPRPVLAQHDLPGPRHQMAQDVVPMLSRDGRVAVSPSTTTVSRASVSAPVPVPIPMSASTLSAPTPLPTTASLIPTTATTAAVVTASPQAQPIQVPSTFTATAMAGHGVPCTLASTVSTSELPSSFDVQVNSVFDMSLDINMNDNSQLGSFNHYVTELISRDGYIINQC